jgi:hypothetical protein
MVVQAAMTTQEIAEATSLDPELSELRQVIITAKRLSKSLDHYRQMLSEMSVTREGIVLRDHRIVIPKSLRKRVVELAHGGQQGIVKTRRLIRSRSSAASVRPIATAKCTSR